MTALFFSDYVHRSIFLRTDRLQMLEPLGTSQERFPVILKVTKIQQRPLNKARLYINRKTLILSSGKKKEKQWNNILTGEKEKYDKILSDVSPTVACWEAAYFPLRRQILLNSSKLLPNPSIFQEKPKFRCLCESSQGLKCWNEVKPSHSHIQLQPRQSLPSDGRFWNL